MATPRWRHPIVALLGAALLGSALVGATLVGAAPQAAAAPIPATPIGCATTTVSAALYLPHVVVASATPVLGGSFTPPGQPAIAGLPPFCAVDLTRTDPAGNAMHVEVWLPKAWNGRFQGIGGAGFSCGISYVPLTPSAPSLETAVAQGYASASTDCGHSGDPLDGSFGLTPQGALNRPLITDFASTGIHDMTVDGKALTSAFYGTPAGYTYFNGCSTGGREGLMEAQRYPADYNGIVSGAPAINWTRFVPAELWPDLVMNTAEDFLPACKETAFTNAVVAACDGLDGVVDGIVADPADCHWDPHDLVGADTPCGTITATDADVMAKIWQGPETARGSSLWFGLEPGTDLSGIAATSTEDGVTTADPFPLATGWLGIFLQRNPNWNWQTLTYSRFDALFAKSVGEFSRTIATDDPDLSAFHRDNGKILIWHGLADFLIFPQGSIDYYRAVQQANSGAAATASFARLFLAPGATHCMSAAGPAPTDPLAAMVSWVERGTAPASIPAALVDPSTGVTTMTRPLCAYPLVARYLGPGATTSAANFTCAPSY